MQISWHPCNCPEPAFDRLHRTWWMRLLFPMRRRYRCLTCNTECFIRPAHLPAASEPPER